MSEERFKNINELSATLKAIASNYEPGSTEYFAIETAAFALLYAMAEQPEAFRNFVEDSGTELTPEMKRRLAELGLN